MKKRRIIIIVLFAFILLVSLSFTYGYFIMQDNTKIIITFGNVKLKLIEKELKNGKYVDVKNHDRINITNITNLSRMVKVKNVGDNSFYLRLKVGFNGISNVNDLMIIETNENWTYKDGYYYYQKVLNSNEETNYLMDEIKFNNQKIIDNYKGKILDFEIKAEAVQSENNVKDVMEITNWPE